MTRHLLGKEGKRHTHEEVDEIRTSFLEAKAEHETKHGRIAPAHQRHRPATVEMHEKNRDEHVAGLKQSLMTVVTHAETPEEHDEKEGRVREGRAEATRDAQEIEHEHEHEREGQEAKEGAGGDDHTSSYKKTWGKAGGEDVPMAVMKEGPTYAHE